MKYSIEKIKTKNDEVIFQVNGFLLHSKYNPIREAERFISEKYKAGAVQVVFGYGNGYFVKALREVCKNNELILVVEPIFDEFEDHSKTNILYRYSQSDLEIFFGSYIKTTDSINVIISPNYDKIALDEYKQFMGALKNRLRLNKVNENTVTFFNKQWQKNYIQNLKNINFDYSVARLENKYDYPIVIASGGPSLDKQLPLVKQYRDKMILIAAGSTINSLLHADIVPDFVVSIDGSELNYEHFKNLDLPNTRLVYGVANHPLIRESFHQKAYFFVESTNEELIRHIPYVTNEKSNVLNGGASVAIFALSLALMMTTAPIAFIGQDLAYTNKKTHASFNKRTKTIDENQELIKVDGYYGEKVESDYIFLSMKKSFEAVMQINESNHTVYNCTEGGVNIEHFINIPFDEFCQQTLMNEVSIVQDFPELDGKKPELLDVLTNEKDKLIKLKRLIVEAKTVLRSNKSDTQFSQSVIKKLDSLEHKMEEIVETSCFSVSMKSINLNILKCFKAKNNETAIETYKRVYEQNNALYNKLIESIDEVIDLLTDEYDQISGRI